MSGRFESHPLADLVRPMLDDEYRELRDDIAANGQQEPITLFEGKVLDGRHRARVCEELGLAPITRELPGGVNPGLYVMSLNVHRRHLTATERALIAVERLSVHRNGARENQGTRSDLGGELPHRPIGKSKTPAHTAAGAETGVSGVTVQRAEAVKRDAPDLYQRVEAGTKTVNAAWEEMRARSDRQARTVPEPKPGRQLQRAEAAKLRVERAVGTCNGLARGLDGLQVDQAVSVATAEEVQGWDASFSDAIAAIKRLRERLKEFA